MTPIDLNTTNLNDLRADADRYRNDAELSDYWESGIDDEQAGSESIYPGTLDDAKRAAYQRGREWAAFIARENELRRALGRPEINPHRA